MPAKTPKWKATTASAVSRALNAAGLRRAVVVTAGSHHGDGEDSRYDKTAVRVTLRTWTEQSGSEYRDRAIKALSAKGYALGTYSNDRVIVVVGRQE